MNWNKLPCPSLRLVWLVGVILSGVLPVWGVARLAAREETAVSATCTTGTQSSGALYQICLPDIPWNGDVVLYAHGYVTPTEPITLPAESVLVATAVNAFGYAFATTSYSTNGLAIQEGLADIIDLAHIFTTTHPTTGTIYLVGFSEGGIITTLAVEQHPDIFDGGLAGCGPIGSFRQQVNYFGDFRVLFDYFFPGLIPGSPTDIPPTLISDWSNFYQTTVYPVISDPANTHLVTQLLAVTGAPYDSAVSSTQLATIYDALRYNIITTNDTIAKLGGQPFDNQNRVYVGSDDDATLNASVARFTADLAALAALPAYETSGLLTAPLVTAHTTLDPIVPAWHEPLYRAKIIQNDNLARHDYLQFDRYGHCNFTELELLAAFFLLVERVENPPVYQPVARLFLPVIEE